MSGKSPTKADVEMALMMLRVEHGHMERLVDLAVTARTMSTKRGLPLETCDCTALAIEVFRWGQAFEERCGVRESEG